MGLPSPECVVCIVVVLLAPAASAQCDYAKLGPSDGTADIELGRSLAQDGTTLVVGAPLATGVATADGAAYVYEQTSGQWGELQKLTAFDASVNAVFGGDVSLDGDDLVVGASGDSEISTGSGAVYAYTRIPAVPCGETWCLDEKIVDPDLSSNDAFGTAVAISGDTVVVGAPNKDIADTDAGAVYVYVRETPSSCSEAWCLQALLTPDVIESIGASVAGAAFGSTVDLDGDTLVVGAPLDGETGSMVEDAGSVWIYVRSGSTWTLEEVLDAGAAINAFDRFGESVAVDGDVVAVGAPDATFSTSAGPGAAHVFTRSGAVWTERERLLPPGGEDGDDFGASVDVTSGVDITTGVTGDLVLVGAPKDAVNFVNGLRVGSAHLYLSTDGLTWAPTVRLTGFDTWEDDEYGTDVSLDGPLLTASIGVPFHDPGGGPSGVVAVHALDVDCDGNGLPDILDAAMSPSANANGNCILDKCEMGNDFEPAVFQVGKDDDPGLPTGGDAGPSVDLVTLVFGSYPGLPILRFDEVPGESGVAATELAFAHTFAGLTNHMTGALLEIGVRATSNASLDPSSDRIALEVLDAEMGTFRWESLLADLPEAPAGGWTNGDDALFTLDLAHLPLPGGGEANLLASLVDDELDIFVDRHSGVDFARLTISHHKPIRPYTVRYDPTEGTPHSTIEMILADLPEVDAIHASEDVLDRIDVLAYEEVEATLDDALAYPWFESTELWPLLTGFASGGTAACPCRALPPDELDENLCKTYSENSNCPQATLEQVLELVGIDRLHPAPYNPEGTLELAGNGMKVGMLDYQHPSHADVCGRVVNVDEQNRVTDHATLVAGILAGDGTTTGGVHHGALPEATVYSYSRRQRFNPVTQQWDLPPTPAPTQILDGFDNEGITIFSNSWGYPEDCSIHSSYMFECPDFDEIVRDMGVSIVIAAGNEQETMGASCAPGFYGRILPTSSAKNVITVGGVCASKTDIPVKPSFGPTRDGRLKPDVVTISERIGFVPYVTGGKTMAPAYQPLICACGMAEGVGATSFATPQATGAVTLLAQANGGTIVPALAKALICNTASDVSTIEPTFTPRRPDYKTGYGLVNAFKAYEDLMADRYRMGTINATDDVDTYAVLLDADGDIVSVAPVSSSPRGGSAPSASAPTPGLGGPGGVPLESYRGCLPRFMLVWSDPKCTENCDEEDPALGGALVNDLDLQLVSPTATATYDPWTLDPAQPAAAATRSPNRRDPVEQVTLRSGEIEPGLWTLTVRGEDVPQGPQDYFITWTTECRETQTDGVVDADKKSPAP